MEDAGEEAPKGATLRVLASSGSHQPAGSAEVPVHNDYTRWWVPVLNTGKAVSREARWRRLAVFAVGLAATVALAGCGTSPRPPAAAVHPATPAATHTPIGAADWPCLNTRERARMFVLDGPGHDRLAALSIGTGHVAVILAHQVAGSLCQWWPYARSLAAAGFRVVAFDFDGFGASPAGDGDYPSEVAAAARWAHHAGAGKVVLMGGSMGGTAVMVAAAHLGASVAGVIDLSGPARYAGMDVLAAARRVHVPVLFGYGVRDSVFASDIRRVRAATATRDKPLVTVGDQTHGAALVDPAVGYAQVRKAVLRFIQATAG
jgi:pimeloyl-ACP methyl ester carboxylesterase